MHIVPRWRICKLDGFWLWACSAAGSRCAPPVSVSMPTSDLSETNQKESNRLHFITAFSYVLTISINTKESKHARHKSGAAAQLHLESELTHRRGSNSSLPLSKRLENYISAVFCNLRAFIPKIVALSVREYLSWLPNNIVINYLKSLNICPLGAARR